MDVQHHLASSTRRALHGAFQQATQIHILEENEDIIRRVITSGQPEWHEDVTTDPAFSRAASAKESGLRSVFACPILVSREVVGVMEFYAPKVTNSRISCCSILGCKSVSSSDGW